KRLTFDIHCSKKQTLAYIENDAIGCYNRIANPLILIFPQIWGIASTATKSLATTWEQTYHRIKSVSLDAELQSYYWFSLT
ncbi:MAG: hypothetical protein ACK55I_26575, partial [bacterium]